jgi:hypothetical protein
MANMIDTKILITLLFLALACTANAQKSQMVGMVGEWRVFSHKGLVSQINRATGVNKYRVGQEMVGSFYKFKGQKWGIETSLSTSIDYMDNFGSWDILHNVSSVTLGANYDLGKMLLADKVLIHTGFDLFKYDIAMRNNNLVLSAPNQPNGIYWSNVSIGFNLGIETIDYLTDDGIFYNLRLGYTFTPNSEWRGTSEIYKSSLQYLYIGISFGYDSGFKASALKGQMRK